MAVPPGDQGIGAALPRFLAQAGEGVILGQNADDGPSLPEAAAADGKETKIDVVAGNAKALVEQTAEDAAQEENPLLLKLPVPYTFEGVCYTKLDLTGVENLTAADLIRASDIVERRKNRPTMVLELDMQYLFTCASFATGLPLEFFQRLPAKDAVSVKNAVSGSFFSE